MKLKLSGATIFAVAGFAIALARPFVGLPVVGHVMLGLAIIVLGLWIFRPGNLPYTAGTVLLIAGGVCAGLPYNIVTAGFASPSFWILVPTLYFGYALQKTGLGKRIVFFVLKSFRPSYFSLIAGWFIVGIILSLLTPSITVRVAIVIPIAVNCLQACNIAPRSRGAALITLVAWAMAVLPGTGWLTGSLWGPVLTGYYPLELKALGTWDAWFRIMALPWFLITIFFVVLVYVLFRPEEPLNVSRDFFLKQYASLGRISRDEIITLSILIVALIFFATERIHHLPNAATALGAFFLLLIFRIITVSEISTGISWDVAMFVGLAIGMSAIFTNARVDQWIVPLLGPSILSLAKNPLVFMLVSTVALWLVRFIDVPWGYTTAAILAPILVPLYREFGIHPVVVTMGITIAGNCFFLSYQQPFIMIGEALAGGKGWSSHHVSLAGLAFGIAAIFILFISVPYWKIIGAIS